MDITQIVANSVIIQIAIALSLVSLAGGLLFIVFRRGVKSKLFRIPGKTNARAVNLDSSRIVVREGTTALCEYYLKLGGDLICGLDKAGCRDSDAEHQYDLIVELLNYEMVEQVMQSLEVANYGELKGKDWTKAKNELFNRVFFSAEASIEKKFRSDAIQLTKLRSLIESKKRSFQTIFYTMADRLKSLAQQGAKHD